MILTGRPIPASVAAMFRGLGSILAALALVAITGGHWLVFQSVAWGQMLRDYSRDASVTEAISKTFSGDYPCSMCHKITETRSKEDTQNPRISIEKKSTEFLAPPRVHASPPLISQRTYPRFAPTNSGIPTAEPDTPVPISV
jgi:hypothetical protein